MSTQITDPLNDLLLIVREAAHVDVEIHADTELLESGLLDSLSLMRLIGKVETAFGIRFPMIELTVENLATPNAMAAFVHRLKAA